jgi:hypothetical protein
VMVVLALCRKASSSASLVVSKPYLYGLAAGGIIQARLSNLRTENDGSRT